MKSGITNMIPILFFFLNIQVSYSDTTDFELDLDVMWENTVWEEIQDVVDVGYEVEKVTPVAGVRGAEAEDEALALLYYRKSMKGLSLLDLQKAYGKLVNRREIMIKDGVDTKKIDGFIITLRGKIQKKS
tara:strand:- start:50998 stop:51387 length:390 start_codon:yes stop_codon:yes gene_type:complete